MVWFNYAAEIQVEPQCGIFLPVPRREVARERQAEIIEMEVMPDHVHLDPQFGIHRLVRLMKRRSSRILRQEFPWLRSRLPTFWTNSYFVATVGGAPLAVIKQYIEQQKRV